MARRILALDLGSHTLKAALVESTVKGCRVLGLFRQPRDPHRALAEQVGDLCKTHNLRGDTVLSCLPGDAVSYRVLTLPFARSRQLAQTIPFELESHIPFTLEHVLVDFQTIERTAAGVTVLAVAVPRLTLAAHLETLAGAGLEPTAVGLVPLASLSLLRLAGEEAEGTDVLLDIGETRTSLVLLRDGVLRGLRTLSVGLSRVGGFPTFVQELRWTLLALAEDGSPLPARFFLCGGGACIPQLRQELEHAFAVEIVPFRQLSFPSVPEEYREEQGVFAACLGLALSEAVGRTERGINLRRGEFTYQGQNAARRRAVTRLGQIAAGVALVAGLATALEIQRLNTRYEALRQEIRRVFTTTLPDQQTIVSEKAQLQDAVTALQSRQRLMSGAAIAPLELLRQLSSGLPEQVSLDLDEWTVDEESARLRGTTTSFDAAETIKTSVAGMGMFREVQLKDVKTTAGGKKVSFALHMLFAQEQR
ncbi:MAG: pilus assembly protein PilM [Deltaproteobacteria bacterium]|nr:pilus assembly protein PilM [Deltaproteobacteria bacterium]